MEVEVKRWRWFRAFTHSLSLFPSLQLGYVTYRRVKGYYSGEEDALDMRKVRKEKRKRREKREEDGKGQPGGAAAAPGQPARLLSGATPLRPCLGLHLPRWGHPWPVVVAGARARPGWFLILSPLSPSHSQSLPRDAARAAMVPLGRDTLPEELEFD